MSDDLLPDEVLPVRGPVRVRARRRASADVRKIARRPELLAAAAILLGRQSVGAVPLTAIGRQAGWSPRICYNYYNNTDELLADLLVGHLAALTHAVGTAFDQTLEQPAPERLTAIARAFLGLVLQQRNEHRALRLNGPVIAAKFRPSIEGRSREIIAILKEVLFGGVPGLDQHVELGGLLLRQWVGAMSDTVTWFKDDDRLDRTGLAQLIASQTLATARAVVSGDWVLPPPARVDTESVSLPMLEAGTGRLDAIWISPEQARRSLPALADAVAKGTEVVLTRRGVPLAKLVPAVAEAARLRRLVRRG
jgi:AcrR family transcriptional regulator